MLSFSTHIGVIIINVINLKVKAVIDNAKDYAHMVSEAI